MASSAIFYMDAATLSLATAVYDNAALTIASADGWYSDGTIVRQQVNGVLLAQAPCPSCTVGVCRTVLIGTVPVSGGASSSASGTITVTGGNVNIWARYNSGGSTSGTAIFSMTINSVNANGTFTITGSGQTGHTSSNGSTGAGYITLTPGTYNFTLVKSDNLTSGNNVRFVWSTGTNPATATEVLGC